MQLYYFGGGLRFAVEAALDDLVTRCADLLQFVGASSSEVATSRQTMASAGVFRIRDRMSGQSSADVPD